MTQYDHLQSIIQFVTYKGKQPLFDFDMFKTSALKFRCEMLQVYVGDGITMYHCVEDVVSFEKDGNILTFNVKEILKEYKEI